MLFVPLGIAACALAVALVYVDQRAAQQRLRRWQAAARRLGLRYEEDRQGRTIQGRLRGVPIRARFERHVQVVGKIVAARETTTFTGGDGVIPRGLSLQRDALSLLGTLLPSRGASIGDPDFDRFAQLTALDEYVCASLSERARALLVPLLRQGGQVQRGLLLLMDHQGSDRHEGWLERQLELLAELGAQLSVPPSTLHHRLAQNARMDPCAGVRLANLRFLTQPRLCAPRELRAATARALLADPAVELRLHAACELAEEGFAALRAIAVARGAGTAPRVQALEALAQAHAPGLEPLLAELLSEPDAPELLVAVLTGIGTLQLRSLRGEVLRCTSGSDEAVRAAAARALAKLVDSPALQASTELRLIRLLDDTADAVQRAAAEALGEIASVRAVEPLLGLTQGLGRGSLRQAARAAIAQIQSRLGSVEAGRLSLADTGSLAGAVALADAPRDPHAGAVTVAEEQPRERGSRAGSPPVPGGRDPGLD